MKPVFADSLIRLVEAYLIKHPTVDAHFPDHRKNAFQGALLKLPFQNSKLIHGELALAAFFGASILKFSPLCQSMTTDLSYDDPLLNLPRATWVMQYLFSNHCRFKQTQWEALLNRMQDQGSIDKMTSEIYKFLVDHKVS